MKMTVQAESLAHAINWAIKGFSSTDTKSTAIKMIIEEDRLTFSAFNGDSSYSSHADVIRELGDTETFEGLVAESSLVPIARSVGKGEIALTVTDKKVDLVSAANKSKFFYPLLQDGKFATPHRSPAHLGTILGSELKDALKKVTAAASTDPSVPVLNSVLFEITPSENKLQLVATNRYQLSSNIINVDIDKSRQEDEKFRVVIPAQSLKKVLTGLGPDENISLSASTKTKGLGISTSHKAAVLGQFDGEYAKVERLLVPTFTDRIILDYKEVKEALAIVAPFATGNPIIAMKISGDVMEISAGGDAGQGGQKKIDIVDNTLEEDITILFAPEYIVPTFNIVNSEKVSMSFSTPVKPVVFHNVDSKKEDTDDLMFLVMPTKDKS